MIKKVFSLAAILMAVGCGSSSNSSVAPTAPSTATVASIAVTGTAALTVSQTSQLTVTATMSDGSSQNVTAQATWVSSSTGVVTVSASGLVTAVGPGSSTITATVQGKTATLALTVAAAVAIPPVSTACAGSSATGSMSAVIDGKPWTAVCVIAAGGTPGLVMSGSDNASNFPAGTVVAIQVNPPSVAPGTYPILISAIAVNGVQVAAGPGGGNIVLTAYTGTRQAGHVAGTFSISLNGHTAANGVFDMTWTS